MAYLRGGYAVRAHFKGRRVGQVLAGLAPSSQTVGSLFRAIHEQTKRSSWMTKANRNLKSNCAIYLWKRNFWIFKEHSFSIKNICAKISMMTCGCQIWPNFTNFLAGTTLLKECRKVIFVTISKGLYAKSKKTFADLPDLMSSKTLESEKYWQWLVGDWK